MGGLLPGCLLLRGQEYDVLSRIGDIDTPLLILHGTADQRVPFELGERVFEAAPLPKFMETYQGGEHEDLARYGSVEDAISFISILRGAR